MILIDIVWSYASVHTLCICIIMDSHTVATVYWIISMGFQVESPRKRASEPTPQDCGLRSDVCVKHLKLTGAKRREWMGCWGLLG